jgi:anti-anti-sigma regulatory factor
VLLKQLGEQPPAIICDLAGVEEIDPMCAGVFSSVRHPAIGWPGTNLELCGARPAVARILARRRVSSLLPVYDSLEEALHHARALPPRLRERIALQPVPAAAAAARSFVRERCDRWGLDGLAEDVTLLANELVTNAVLHARTPLQLRLELRGPRLYVAVHDHDPRLVRLLAAEDRGDRMHGLSIVERIATAWGVRQDPDGGKVVWCALDLPPDRAAREGGRRRWESWTRRTRRSASCAPGSRACATSPRCVRRRPPGRPRAAS